MKKVALAVILVFAFLVVLQNHMARTASAQTSDEKLQQLSSQIEQYQKEIDRLKSAANTLANQIAQFDAQIKLTTLKITETQEKIDLLGGRIDRLEVSLDSLSNAFSSRVVETYKMARVGEPLFVLISSQDLNQAVSRFHYLQKIQEADRDLLMRLEKAQDVYEVQKEAEEDLQAQLKKEKANLDGQKAAKAHLLAATKNDEKKYQQLLAAARSEFEAIQAIIAGRGTEEEVGPVSEGARIASVIQGASCNSGGTHLHFIVKEGTTTQNPFNYLSGGIAYENCSGSSCGSSDGDSFNPSGNWSWPISPTIKYNQGYGSTWAIRNTWVGRIYSFHNGIDINGSSPEVKAVRAGRLFRGSYGGSAGCRLRYVRLDHDDSNLETLYLHINY